MDFDKELARLTRRGFIGSATAGILLYCTNADAYVEELMKTPALTEGPFYPDKMPLDRDNDLIIIGKSTTPAIGTITHLRGRVMDIKGNPIKNAMVEIWQCDANQVYLHTKDSIPKAAQQDKNFQGYGMFETDSKGNYYFRTIKPVPYPGRPAPHIHIKVKKEGKELITTQLMIKGFAGNMQDGIFRQVGGPAEQARISADFLPKKDSKIGELNANHDIIVGLTHNELSTH